MVYSSVICLFAILPLFLLEYYLLLSPVKYAKRYFLKRKFLGITNSFIFLSSILFCFWGVSAHLLSDDIDNTGIHAVMTLTWP
jgi:hypothetical protein